MKIQVNKQNVGLRIKQLRQDKGYTLEEFGKLFNNASKGNIQYWENGKSLPNKERIKAIAELGDKTVNELLYGSVEEFVKENYYNLDNNYSDLSSDDIEFLKKRNDFDRDRQIKIICELALKNNITVNELEKIYNLADEIINLSDKVNDKMYYLLSELIRKLDEDDLKDLSNFLYKKLQCYSLSEKEEEILNDIGLYLVEGVVSDNLLADNSNLKQSN